MYTAYMLLSVVNLYITQLYTDMASYNPIMYLIWLRACGVTTCIVLLEYRSVVACIQTLTVDNKKYILYMYAHQYNSIVREKLHISPEYTVIYNVIGLQIRIGSGWSIDTVSMVKA